jgi:tetratricopeptide (TPR) repeat protein
MKRVLLWAALLLCQACQGQDPNQQLLAAEQALNAGKPEEALHRFDALLHEAPEHERALVLRSKAKYQLQDYRGALVDAQRVLAIDSGRFTPHDYTALLNAGIASNNLRQFAPARRYLARAKAIDSTDVRLYEGIGYSWLEEQNYPAAAAEYSRAVQAHPDAKRCFYGLGKAWMLLTHYPEAILAYDRALALDSGYAMAYQNRASAKYLVHDTAGCCTDLQRCEELGLKDPALTAFREQVCH